MQTYRRVVVTQWGGPERMEVQTAPVPLPGPGQVRVRVKAAGVSFADLLMREGVHPERRRPPFTPGWDIVGVVEAIGPEVDRSLLGANVAALTITGGYSEVVILPASDLVLAPPGIDPVKAVCLVLDGVVAWQMVVRLAHAGPGDSVLIHRAAGGVGTQLLQVANLVGLRALGTVSGPKHGLVTRLGGIPIDYQAVDFVAEVKRLTGKGVDAVFDPIGGEHLWQSYRALNSRGRLVFYGLSGALREGRRKLVEVAQTAVFSTSAFGLNLIPTRRRVFLYSIQRLKRRRPQWYREDLMTLFNRYERGQLDPVIYARLPLEQAAHAHELLAQRVVTGKIVLQMGEGSTP